MQGMEDTINTLKIENKALKEGHEKLQIQLNSQTSGRQSDKNSEDEILKLRKRVQSLQENLAELNQINTQN